MQQLKYKDFLKIYRMNEDKLLIKIGLNNKKEFEKMKYIPKKAKESKIFANSPMNLIEFYNDLGGFYVKREDSGIFEQ